MNEDSQRATTAGSTSCADAGLYLWSGGGIVLMGQKEDDTYVLARGWIEADRLAHVRRWRFATAKLLAGQVRRLVKETCGDNQRALAESQSALVRFTALDMSRA